METNKGESEMDKILKTYPDGSQLKVRDLSVAVLMASAAVIGGVVIHETIANWKYKRNVKEFEKQLAEILS
jgi:hypothetical protein